MKCRAVIEFYCDTKTLFNARNALRECLRIVVLNYSVISDPIVVEISGVDGKPEVIEPPK